MGKFKNKAEYETWKKEQGGRAPGVPDGEGVQEFETNKKKREKMSSARRYYIAFAVVVVLIIIASITDRLAPPTNIPPPAQSDSVTYPSPEKWKFSVSEDKMTGKLSAYAYSPSASATEQMDFPYGNVNARLGVGCDADSEWAYFIFNQSPNLSNTSIKDGYSQIRTRIKWDDQAYMISLTQDWGSSSIHFIDDESAFSSILTSRTVLLELGWFGEGNVYFQFSLKGASEASARVRSACKGRVG